MLEIGSLIDGKYKILNVVGKGGMSIVYLAMNEKANKQWAIKEIRKDGVQDYEVVKQNLIVETNLLKQLRHTNLPSIVDVIDEEDSFLIVMDYIEGVPLSTKLKEEGAQNQEDVIDWAKQLCSVLGYLHTRTPAIIYRDLKPANIMLKPDGNIVLIDFGTARTFKEKNVEDTQCLGTRGYAAPEQYGGRGQTDARTDIYCLGVTLYHLVTGHNPSEPPYELYPIRQWIPTLSAGLEELILKCIQQNPADRYQSCAELMYMLDHYEELDATYQKKQNRRLFLFGISAACMVLSGVVAVGAYFAEQKQKENTYEVYMQEAKLEAREMDAIEKYKQAIALAPQRGEAYIEMLENVILNDDVLTEEEAYAIRDCLNQSDGSSETNETLFSTNTRVYEQFAYELGIAYFYSYEEKGNKSLAKKWLEVSANAQTLESSQVERAKRLGKIADYYAKIGMENKAGDASVSYADYWKDLVTLTEGNLVELDNATTAIIMYKELVYQIYTNCVLFRDAGIGEEEMQKQLENVEIHMKNDFDDANQQNKERVEKLLAELQEYMDLAKEAVYVTFVGVEK